jgi:hypothetical protein
MRFYMDYWNRRDKNYGVGMKDGCGAHLRGWYAGVRVTLRAAGPDDCADSAEVYMTSGSSGGTGDTYLGTVYDTPDGPVWVPAKVPAKRKRRAIPRRLRALYAPKRPPRREAAPAPRVSAATAMAAIAHSQDRDERHPEWRPDQSTTPEGTLARIDAALAGPSLDHRVFGPESNLPGEY